VVDSDNGRGDHQIILGSYGKIETAVNPADHGPELATFQQL